MFLNRWDQRPLTRKEFWEGLELVFRNLKQIMANQAQLAADLRSVKTQLDKIATESQALLDKISELEAELENQDVTPELQAAFDAVKSQAQTIDDLVPDSSELPANVANPPAGPDVASLNPLAQTHEEKAAGASPGTLPDVNKQRSETTLESGQVQSEEPLPGQEVLGGDPNQQTSGGTPAPAPENPPAGE